MLTYAVGTNISKQTYKTLVQLDGNPFNPFANDRYLNTYSTAHVYLNKGMCALIPWPTTGTLTPPELHTYAFVRAYV